MRYEQKNRKEDVREGKRGFGQNSLMKNPDFSSISENVKTKLQPNGEWEDHPLKYLSG